MARPGAAGSSRSGRSRSRSPSPSSGRAGASRDEPTTPRRWQTPRLQGAPAETDDAKARSDLDRGLARQRYHHRRGPEGIRRHREGPGLAVRLRGRLDKEDRLLGPVKLERSIPVKGTQLRKGLPAPPPNITPPFVSNYYSTFVTTGSLPLRRCCCRDLLINMAVCCIGKHRARLQSKHDVHRLAHQARLLGYRHLYRHGTASKKLYPVLKLRTDIIVTCTYHAVLVSNDQHNGRRGAVI
jgi:hypothetical protein